MSRFAARVFRDFRGYRWTRPEKGQPLLIGESYEALEWNVPNVRASGIVDEFVYDPFVEEPALFRILSELEPSEDAIQKFATKYGAPIHLGRANSFHGTSLLFWEGTINRIRGLVEVADALSEKRTRQRLNEVEEMLKWIADRLELTFLPVRLEDGFQLQSVAQSFDDAIFLQLAESITEQKQYRWCELCSKPFELAPGKNRADRVYCTENCRIKAFQRRKRQVVQLFRDGQSVKQIVAATNNKRSVVVGWLKHEKEK